ncbi:MAG: Rieske (2Fe-2S) protein [Hyphomicrobiales bacterium]|nr:Rieske (2Fe-2S) protein [Hyphomicrobiales bacterium]
MDGWHRVATLDELADKGRLVVKPAGRQIALFLHGARVLACNNRCPHEGYPLAEGDLAAAGGNGGGGDACILTCNWHNWKFDLNSGAALVGGDAVTVYPTRVADGQVWVEVSGPTAEERRDRALAGLRDSFDDHDYGRMARETARLVKAGGDPLDAVRAAVAWTHDRFEFGMTHALAALPDWLALGEAHARDDAERLVPVVEAVAYLAWDSQRAPSHPFTPARLDWDPDALFAAIEGEDEGRAAALVRGGVAAGAGFDDFAQPLARAALEHYLDFGHGAIYVLKAGEAVDRLGPGVLEPVLLSLVRMLIYGSREDLIPEFREYGPALARWHGAGDEPVAAADFDGLGVAAALARILHSGRRRDELYQALLGAAARAMLHFDLARQGRTDNPVQDNVTWLGFTHALTFANAVRALCGRVPDLWPRGLLQMGCFLGRNARYVDLDQDVADWRVDDADAFFDAALRGLFDHGSAEYIVPAHLVKTLTAVRRELAAAPGTPARGDLLAALNRFLHSPLKRKHVLRTARQSLEFVARED